MTRTAVFAREQLRATFALALLVVIPALFVVSAAGALSDFASALGGSLAGDAAVGLSAGWAAAFISGALGFFQAASSRAPTAASHSRGSGRHAWRFRASPRRSGWRRSLPPAPSSPCCC